MIDGIPLSLLGGIGTGTLVTLFVLLMYFRKIVPEKTLKDEQEHTSYWRGVAMNKDTTISNQAEALRYVCEQAGLSVSKVMGELQDKAGVPKE